jgi:hypothetical protein
MNNENNSMEGFIDLSTPTTKILAIGSWTPKGLIKSDRLPVMIKEVPATVNLYLTGAIEQWYIKPDLSGVVFVMNVTDPAEAHRLLEKLPLGVADMMAFDFIPLGPISPLRFLFKNEPAN